MVQRPPSTARLSTAAGRSGFVGRGAASTFPYQDAPVATMNFPGWPGWGPLAYRPASDDRAGDDADFHLARAPCAPNPPRRAGALALGGRAADRKSTRLNSSH